MRCRSCDAPTAADARFCSMCGESVAAGETYPSDPLRELLQAELSPNIEIVRPLGRGGMGAVYLGREPSLDREVAIKTLLLETTGAADLRERFRREARIAAKLLHPNIVPLFTFGETRDVIYYVMGFVRGESLAERLGREGSLPHEDVRRILHQLAEALEYAHERGIVHRDIKPENVLVEDTSGRAILTDFGIARVHGGTELTEAGRLVGTPNYMSPEQARGDDVEPMSDIYSSGVLGYRMLTGKLPVRADSLPALVAQLASESGPNIEPLPREIPADLAGAVMRCLRRDPRERWTAGALRGALRLDEENHEVPEAMRPFESRAFFVSPFVVFACLLLTFEIVLWEWVEPSWRMAILLFQFGSLLAAGFVTQGVAEGRKLGLPMSVIANVLFRPPRWFFGWVPRWMRHAGDYWARLPLVIRLFRIAVTATYLSLIPICWILPFGIVGIQANLDVGRWLGALAIFEAALVGVLCVIFVRADRILAQRGLTAEERSRALSSASLLRSAWSEPKLAELLVPAALLRVDEALESAERIMSRITSRARRLPKHIAEPVLSVVRDLKAAIANLDTETARIDALFDPADVEHVERRIAALDDIHTAQETEVRKVLVEQRRVFRDLAAKRSSLSRERGAWMARLRVIDALIGEGETVRATEIEQGVKEIREDLVRERDDTAIREETTAIQRQ